MATPPVGSTRVSSCSTWASADTSTARARAGSSCSPARSVALPICASRRPSWTRSTTPTTVCEVESATVFVPQSKTSECPVKKLIPFALLAVCLALLATGCGSEEVRRNDRRRPDDDCRLEQLQGRSRHRPRRPERPQLQPPRLRRPAAGGDGLRRAERASSSLPRPPNTSRTSARSRGRGTTS